MLNPWWLGIVAGVLIAGSHTLLRVLAHRLARRSEDPSTFTTFALGGMLVRMAVVLLATGLVLALVDVNAAAFVVTLLALLVLSMIGEIAQVVRDLNETSNGK